MGDWDEDWESSAPVTITKAENTFAKEDTVDTEAVEKKAKEDAKKKLEEENKKKKEAEEAAKKKKGVAKKITYSDQFELPDTSKVITKLKEKKFQKDGVTDMFDGATHPFSEQLDAIELGEAEDFRVLGSLLGNKLCDPDYFLVHVEDFYKNLLDATYDKLTSKELQEISSKINVLLQQKQKEEKGGAKKGKAKGPTLAASKSKKAAVGSDSDEDEGLAYKANFNEDDFI